MKNLQDDIRDTIVLRRRNRIAREGHALGTEVPVDRKVPLVRFGHSASDDGSDAGARSFIICEIKRRSPSKGEIDLKMNAAEQAGKYVASGIQNISVLTEEEHFGGTLADILTVKQRFPDAAVMRKDFLVDEEDIHVSYRAGSDAVLLIASILTGDELERLYDTARSLGMECLVEVHTEEDIEKAAGAAPGLVGINSRDLDTFKIDLTVPLRLRNRISWNARLVFESGITSLETAFYALTSGFGGVLVGEAAVRDPDFVRGLAELTAKAAVPGTNARSGFWRRLYARYRPGRPLVKVCGICRPEDGIMAAEAGADILGFVFAESPRRSGPEVPKALRGLDVLKAAVVVCGPGDRTIPDEVRGLVEEGMIDAVQFHGDETPEQCFKLAYPYYKAVRVKDASDIKRGAEYSCPRVLLDAYVPEARGGTGVSVDRALFEAEEKRGMWLAGGLGPRNIKEVMNVLSPELVDISSGLELFPGKKDRDKTVRFFEELGNGIS